MPASPAAKLLKPVILLCLLLFSLKGLADTARVTADHNPLGGYTVEIEGEIGPSLREDIIETINKNKGWPHRLKISSPGGSVIGALRAGKLARELLIPIRVQIGSNIPQIGADHGCSSACALFFAANYRYTHWVDTGRDVEAKNLHFHRPFLKEKYLSSISLSEASNKQEKIEDRVRSYLREMGIKKFFIDQVMSTQPDSTLSLSTQQFKDINGNPSGINDWLKAKCNNFSPKEEKDFKEMRQARANITSFGVCNDSGECSIPSDLSSQESQRLSLQIEYLERLSEGYKDYLRNKNTNRLHCENKLINKKREKTAEKMPDLVNDASRETSEGSTFDPEALGDEPVENLNGSSSDDQNDDSK